jgi:hypothetical protein
MPDWSQLRKDDPHPEPNALVRLASYAAMIGLTGAVVGVAVWGWYMPFTLFHSEGHDGYFHDIMKNDTMEAMSARFWGGCALGAFIALGFIVAYRIRHGRTHLDD